nr:MAG TPA: chitin synthase regulator [Caudoviricetes sp.]
MKALIEVALMWGIALATVLAVFLLNFWINERRQNESTD